MKRKYRIKYLNTKQKYDYHDSIDKTVHQLISSKAFQTKIKNFCAEKGRSYMTVMGILMALGDACKRGRAASIIGQQKIADNIGVNKSTVNKYMKDMEAYGIIGLLARERSANESNNVKWRTTNLTILTCLFEYAERCAYWWRSAMNQKNRAAEAAKSLAKSLIGVRPLHSCSFNNVDPETGEIFDSNPRSESSPPGPEHIGWGKEVFGVMA